jgi:hypothetical protein
MMRLETGITPASPLKLTVSSAELSPAAKKSAKESPDLQKCSLMVETIGVLSEINDCPVEMNLQD